MEEARDERRLQEYARVSMLRMSTNTALHSMTHTLGQLISRLTQPVLRYNSWYNRLDELSHIGISTTCFMFCCRKWRTSMRRKSGG